MRATTITKREPEADDCLITDSQLPDHQAAAWTENVRYLEDAVDVRTCKLYTRSSGTRLQYISKGLQSKRGPFLRVVCIGDVTTHITFLKCMHGCDTL